MSDIHLKIRGLDDALRDLKKFRESAVPYAIRDSLNVSAHACSMLWDDEMGNKFTLRNKFTQRSIRVVHAKGLDTRRMIAICGSVSPYLDTQEIGGTVKGEHGFQAIPGPVAAGIGAGGKRTKRVRQGRYTQKIHVLRVVQFPTRAQTNAVALAMAKRKGLQFAKLQRPNGGTGLYLIGGGTGKKRRRYTARLLWDTSKSSVRISPHATLQPALARMPKVCDAIYENALKAQCRRWKIAGY